MTEHHIEVAGPHPALVPGLGALARCRVVGRDGPIGRVKDLFFDDHGWTVRYFAVDLSAGLPPRRILVSPLSVLAVDMSRRCITTALTRAQAEGSPGVQSDRPVSRQHEIDLAVYLGFPFYWRGDLRWGATESPAALLQASSHAEPTLELATGDPHLRSMRAVHGYAVRASDGHAGHLADFLVEPATGAVRYLEIRLRNRWPTPRALIGADQVLQVSWEGTLVQVDASGEAIRSAPSYGGPRVLNRAWETRLAAHYGRPGYWERPAREWRVGAGSPSSPTRAHRPT